MTALSDETVYDPCQSWRILLFSMFPRVTFLSVVVTCPLPICRFSSQRIDLTCFAGCSSELMSLGHAYSHSESHGFWSFSKTRGAGSHWNPSTWQPRYLAANRLICIDVLGKFYSVSHPVRYPIPNMSRTAVYSDFSRARRDSERTLFKCTYFHIQTDPFAAAAPIEVVPDAFLEIPFSRVAAWPRAPPGLCSSYTI